jgi:hypothetical protein
VSATDTWTCIGDINRMGSQAQRGGGTLCLHRADVHTAMSDLIADTAPCNQIR